MKKLNVAVIGCGAIANNAHIPAYLKNKQANIVYFCDIIPERAENAVAKYGCGKAITDWHDIVSDPEIDAVSVCTPNHIHDEISITCLKAGKHVLCEKPAAPTYEQALAMQQAQHETGKVLNIGVCNRFNTAVNRIRDYIQAGDLGEILQTYVSFRSPRSIPGLGGAFTTKAIAGGGVLIDWGVHFLDIVMYCCGDPKAKTVSAELFSCLGKDIAGYAYKDMWAGPPILDGTYDVEEMITGMVRTTGPVITFNGAWAQNIFETEMFIDFIGSKGGIRLQYGKDFTVYKIENGAMVSYTPKFSSTNHYENEINEFLRCIQDGDKLASHIDTNIITAQLMQAIYDSAETHKEVTL